MHHLLEHINQPRYKKETKQRQSVNSKYKLNARAKEIQQVLLVCPTNSQSIIEESKAANPDWVDRQSYSLLQYINAAANLFITGNYFNELR